MLLSIGGARMSIEPLFHKNLPAHERFLLEGYNVEIYGVLLDQQNDQRC